jgi:hypothetical protein
MVHVMRRIPGIRLENRDVRDSNGSEEIDLVFWNDRLPNGLPFLPNVLIFECKNWLHRVGSESVVFFLNKARTRRLRCAFMVAASGITGDAVDLSAAYRHVNNAFVQDNVQLIILDRQDLEQLSGPRRFRQLIQHKISDIVLRARP